MKIYIVKHLVGGSDPCRQLSMQYAPYIFTLDSDCQSFLLKTPNKLNCLESSCASKLIMIFQFIFLDFSRLLCQNWTTAEMSSNIARARLLTSNCNSFNKRKENEVKVSELINYVNTKGCSQSCQQIVRKLYLQTIQHFPLLPAPRVKS